MAARRNKARIAVDESEIDAILGKVVGLIAAIRRRQAALSRAFGVSMLQFAAVHALAREEPMNITGLARALHLNQSTVSSLVDRMERDGLVRRVQSKRDRRSVRLSLTERALGIANRVKVSPFDFFKSLLRALEPEEVTALGRMVDKIERALFERFAELDRSANA
jgi:MarR family transcriptional regulator, organic hydroperoxide resistance regulator